jgi:ribosome maturation factor RimP
MVSNVGVGAGTRVASGVASGVATSLRAVIETTVAGMGYDLVDVELAGRGLVRVFIDRPQAPIRMEDCERVSHQLTHVLTVENLPYERLEVSSPGLDRPLKRPVDFERFAGESVHLRLRQPLSGRRNFEGVLTRGDAEGRWALDFTDIDGKTVKRLSFTLDEIERARLVPRVKF